MDTVPSVASKSWSSGSGRKSNLESGRTGSEQGSSLLNADEPRLVLVHISKIFHPSCSNYYTEYVFYAQDNSTLHGGRLQLARREHCKLRVCSSAITEINEMLSVGSCVHPISSVFSTSPCLNNINPVFGPKRRCSVPQKKKLFQSYVFPQESMLAKAD